MVAVAVFFIVAQRQETRDERRRAVELAAVAASVPHADRPPQGTWLAVCRKRFRPEPEGCPALVAETHELLRAFGTRG